MLKVNEFFGPTVQGEGKSAGERTMFIRMALCNLQCIWCDSPYTWNFHGVKSDHPKKYNRLDEISNYKDYELFDKIKKKAKDLKMVVISGGEPLIQQDKLIGLLRLFREDNWWIEIETNGTIRPRSELVELVDQINCSPKLANSENPLPQRTQKGVLKALAKLSKANFKFVVSGEEDIPEILKLAELIKEEGNSEIRLMPLAKTRKELWSREAKVKELCKKHNFIYTTRLSILMCGTKRGV